MAAGLGFKDFVTGEVLTAADVDGYLMQGVWVFASAAARDAAVTSPQEGNFAYLKDTNVTTYYTGSAWANLDTTGMTNPMTTTGDTIYSSSGSTPARLGIGTTGQVLTVAGGVPSWATSSSGGMTLISTTTLAGSTTLSSIPGTYNTLQVQISRTKNSAGNYDLYCFPNNQTLVTDWISNRGTTSLTFGQDDYIRFTGTTTAMQNDQSNAWTLTIYDYASASNCKPYTLVGGYYNNAKFVMMTSGFIRDTAAITSLVINGAGSSNSGTVLLYGVK